LDHHHIVLSGLNKVKEYPNSSTVYYAHSILAPSILIATIPVLNDGTIFSSFRFGREYIAEQEVQSDFGEFCLPK
jgi:hypothetical protein